MQIIYFAVNRRKLEVFSSSFLKNLKFLKNRLFTLAMDESDHFRETFKYFKRRKTPEDLSGVVDFESENLSELVIPHSNLMETDTSDTCTSCFKLGLIPHNKWHIYSLKSFNGFMYVKNPFTIEGQKYWIRKCLEVYARKPSVTNLDRHYKSIDDIWTLRNDDDPVKCKLIDKLTWSTLGYHYNWDAKVYDPTNYSDFPECLSNLAKHIASVLNFKSFKPETAIVNYYNIKSSLGIHTDHSEDYLEEPIISLSFGQTALFLLGTKLKTEKPVPMFLRSGDIVIMSGPCRTCYHAVPSIIQEPVYNRYYASDDHSEWKPFHEYIEKHRINISVRQVYKNMREAK